MLTITQPRNKSYYLLGSLLIAISIATLTSFNINAMPSFARQTGVPCSQCHTQSFGPNLTPFGRDFKLGGYTMGGGTGANAKLPPISGMVMGSFTNTQKSQTVQSANQPDGVLLPGNNKNNNFTFDQASLFYAGRIYGNVGAFSQLTYDGYADRLGLDNTDIRFADQLDVFDMPVTYGISLNNNPTVQDLWNTTPAWGFPIRAVVYSRGWAQARLLLAHLLRKLAALPLIQ